MGLVCVPLGVLLVRCGFPVVRCGQRVVCTALISSLVISLNRFVVDSLALQILMYVSRDNFGSASSVFLVLLSERPKTILYLCLSARQNYTSSPKNVRRSSMYKMTHLVVGRAH